jgi:TonB family protein
MRATAKMLVLLLLSGSVFAENKKDEAAKLFQTALKLSDIRTPNSPPFRLEARIVRTDKGQATEGKYLEIWVSTRRWRREVTFGDYHLVQVSDPADEKHSWVVEPKSGLGSGKEMLEFAQLKDLHQFLNPKRVFQISKNGLQLACVENKGRDEHSGENIACLDTGSGALQSVEHSSNGLTWQADYSQYMPFGAYTFPRTMKFGSADGSASLEFSVTDLVSEPTYDAAIFSRPENSEHRSVCTSAEPPRLIDAPSPEYPRGPSGSHVVAIGVIVETNGRPRDIKVLRSEGQAFDSAAIRAVQNWTFTPASCDGEPFPASGNLEVSFKP